MVNSLVYSMQLHITYGSVNFFRKPYETNTGFTQTEPTYQYSRDGRLL